MCGDEEETVGWTAVTPGALPARLRTALSLWAGQRLDDMLMTTVLLIACSCVFL